ncbi:MAG: helix-turn-helix transcriptional regulator, partial [Raoultibacter sp.]
MVRSDIRSYLTIAKRELCEAPTSWLAFSALLAWMFGLYWSDLFVFRLTTTSFEFLELRALWLAVEAVALLVLYFGLLRVLKHSSGVAVVAGTFLFVGSILVLFAPSGFAFDGMRIVGVVLTGLGGAALLALLGIRYARKGPKLLLVNVALALFVAALFDSILLYLPLDLQLMIVALLPVVCVALYVASARNNAVAEGLIDGSTSTEAVEVFTTNSTKINIIRIVALPLIVGLAYGLMQRLTSDAYTSGAAGVNTATIVSFFLSSVFIALAALFIDSRKLIKLVCFAAIPTVGIAFVMLPLFSDAREAAQAICIIGFNSFYFMVWALWAGDRAEPSLPKRFVLGLFVLVGAESLGSVLGVPVVAALDDSGSTLAVVSLVVVYLLLMAGIFSFDRSGTVDQEQQAVVGAELSGQIAMGDRDLDIWVQRYGLSARETEVFELLAKGRNRVFISKALFISDNTTRTHMKNIYRKLDVHSQ